MKNINSQLVHEYTHIYSLKLNHYLQVILSDKYAMKPCVLQQTMSHEIVLIQGSLIWGRHQITFLGLLQSIIVHAHRENYCTVLFFIIPCHMISFDYPGALR